MLTLFFSTVVRISGTIIQDTVEKRQGKEFISIEEFAMTCSKLSKTHIAQFRELGAFGEMVESSQVALF